MGPTMAKTIPLTLTSLEDRSYAIRFCLSWEELTEGLRRLVRPYSACCVVTDSRVGPLHGANVLRALEGKRPALLTFPAGERSKTLTTVGRICETMLRRGFDRKSCMVALGGGVVGDVAGFVAGVFMRGIPFVQVPTTLLACVDSSVGGKTGVDLPSGKNSCGLFNQPVGVLVHPAFLDTLPDAEFANGLVEAVKHGMIRDAGYFRFIDRNLDGLRRRDARLVVRLVEGSCRIKAAVVAADERESGLRMVLNFGHTVGHALEAESGYRIGHGRAVAQGMLVETRLGVLAGVTPPEVLGELEGILGRMGLGQVRLPPVRRLMMRMLTDKKNTRDAAGALIPLVLPMAVGSVRVVRFRVDELARMLGELYRF